MPTDESPAPAAQHGQDRADIHDVLERIRHRPGTVLPVGASLHDVRTLLIGYHLALGFHDPQLSCDFLPGGAFGRWLGTRIGASSPLGWAADIERVTPDGSTPVEEFFRLLDVYRSDPARNPAPAPVEPPGHAYMSNSFVTLFWRQQLLTRAARRLAERGFRVVHLAAGEWATERDMHRAVAAALHFPDYYGNNLDALNDCLGDVACYGGYDDAPEGAGLVLALADYDHFATACPRAAWIVLDVIARLARRAALRQRRFFCLVHSNDADIRFEPVGAMPVIWNRDEWLDANRR